MISHWRLKHLIVDIQDYLKYLMEYGIYLYGETFPSINVHSLLHLNDDYEVKIKFVLQNLPDENEKSTNF